MASISNPIQPKKRKTTWLMPSIILMVIGLPFMLFAFSPYPVLPADAKLTGDAVVFLDGNHNDDAKMTIDTEQLLQIASQSHRSRRPKDAKNHEQEALELSFTLAASENSTTEQSGVLRIFHNVPTEGTTGYIQIGQFAYALSDPANLEIQIRSACKPM